MLNSLFLNIDRCHFYSCAVSLGKGDVSDMLQLVVQPFTPDQSEDHYFQSRQAEAYRTFGSAWCGFMIYPTTNYATQTCLVYEASPQGI